MKKIVASMCLAISLVAAPKKALIKESQNQTTAATWTVIGSLDGKTMGFGQGTAVTKRLLVTCAHFWRADDPDPVAFILKNNLLDKKNVNVIYRDYELDIAVLELDKVEKSFRKKEYIWLADDTKQGEQIIVNAATMGSQEASSQVVAQIYDTNTTHMQMKTISGRFGHGHSGGGVFDNRGELAGVITHATKDGNIGAAVRVERLYDALQKALREIR